MVSKKQKILNMSEDKTAAEVAEELDTSKQYVYKVRSAANSTAEETEEGNTEPEPSPTISEGSEPETEPENNEPSETLEMGEEEAEERDLPEGDTDNEQMKEETAEDLQLTDSGGKSYECGECGASLEYLQKSCECGAKPAWSAIAK